MLYFILSIIRTYLNLNFQWGNMRKTALTSRELYHDLNGKKEIRGIGWFKNSLIVNMVIEGLEKNTPSIKVHVKSFKIIMRSYNEIFQNLRVILCFCSSLDSLCFLYWSLPFALFFLHLSFLHLSFASQMAYSSPQKPFGCQVHIFQIPP